MLLFLLLALVFSIPRPVDATGPPKHVSDLWLNFSVNILTKNCSQAAMAFEPTGFLFTPGPGMPKAVGRDAWASTICARWMNYPVFAMTDVSTYWNDIIVGGVWQVSITAVRAANKPAARWIEFWKFDMGKGGMVSSVTVFPDFNATQVDTAAPRPVQLGLQREWMALSNANCPFWRTGYAANGTLIAPTPPREYVGTEMIHWCQGVLHTLTNWKWVPTTQIFHPGVGEAMVFWAVMGQVPHHPPMFNITITEHGVANYKFDFKSSLITQEIIYEPDNTKASEGH
eukprot:TRINITY_DN27797_c0_g1_i1.p1 TRINITY_DN27797_c0_g1~~TRINITY_DN27797_c0_g1_i1.p1  ORF type:complete len:285 (-),score=4.79 TRINITY_DN27797_c0_g1_i1:418-1272(-)